MDKNTFFQYKESQAHSGYRSAILYKEPSDTKYRFLCASETVPFFGESKETFEFDLVNSVSIGKVEGKENAEAKEIELLYTRNNAILFEKLKDRVLDFMSLTPQLVGYKATGTISFRPNDATNDIHRATYTITPMDVDPTPYFTARDMVLEPIFVKSAVPDEISIASLDTTATTVDIAIELNVSATGVTVYYKTISLGINGVETEGEAETLTITNGKISLPKTAGLYVVYIDPTVAEGSSATQSGTFFTVYITA